ncbi:hypothetical protein GCM10010211_63550 [Streptomyces albospinus]|uniref:Secreted protein n=1 Tax=Streptomyces albospinus TaxID=285515 RepID=A0ABQ2VJ91_9ACTN|nr:hypothetical protein [Streptomyces albospinus]GGU88402.1 hypothetical protein GCM10010211_63550 [Streptomyces albospinus]
MTRTKQSLAVAAVALAALGGAAVPAMADNHIPVAAAPLDSHLPMAPQDNHIPLSPQDNHIP